MFTTTTSFPGAGGGGGGGGGAVSGGRYEQPVGSMHPYPVYHVGGVGGVDHMGGGLMYPYHPLYPPVGGMGGLGGLGGVGAMGGGIGAMGLQHQVDTSRKRAREPDYGAGEYRAGEYDESGASSSKRRAGSQDVLFRMVVPSKHIGRVIGKEGSRIRQIREETGATIKIADAIVPHEERVIIISSAADEAKVSHAETALYAIAKAILKENDDASEASGAGAGHMAANAIRLLIAGSQAGCLIGVSGQTIEQIRNSSGAAISILAPNQLPLCASAHESDRVVQLSGDVPEILKALEKIGSMLRENPSTKVISVRTSYNPSLPGSNPSNFQVPPADYVTSEMTIMEKFVGGLIGRNGYNISRIRNVSGATIKFELFQIGVRRGIGVAFVEVLVRVAREEMGAFISRFWFMLFPAKGYKIVVVGLDNTGKTTTLYKLHLGEVITMHPTVGSNVEELIFHFGEIVTTHPTVGSNVEKLVFPCGATLRSQPLSAAVGGFGRARRWCRRILPSPSCRVRRRSCCHRQIWILCHHRRSSSLLLARGRLLPPSCDLLSQTFTLCVWPSGLR